MEIEMVVISIDDENDKRYVQQINRNKYVGCGINSYFIFLFFC